MVDEEIVDLSLSESSQKEDLRSGKYTLRYKRGVLLPLNVVSSVF